MLELIRKEPVAFQALIQAAVALFVSFGLKLDAGQVGAIVSFTAAALAFLTRTQVTPLANPKDSTGRSLVPGAVRPPPAGLGAGT